MNRTTVAFAVARAVAALPLRLGLALGGTLGLVAWLLGGARRQIAATNIAACFPELSDRERRRLLRRTMMDTGIGMVEALQALLSERNRWKNRVELVGFEHLDGRGERGQLIVSGHSTTVELGLRLFNEAMDAPAAVVVRRNNRPEVEARINAGRMRHAPEVIGKRDVRRMLRVLRDGGRLLYAPDQNFRSRVVFAPFFGVTTATLTATADIAARSGAQVVSGWVYRLPGARYRIVADPPWENFPSGDALADATRINAWLERSIREAPEQYLWVHRRFGHRPEGEPPFYPPRARRRERT